jgi:hypothetical protein
VLEFPWFGAFYIGVSFVFLPVALYGCSLLLNFGTPGLIANIVLNVLVVGGTVAFMMKFKQVYSALTGRPTSVPDEGKVEKQDIENQTKDYGAAMTL